jgi:hypothetical protein
MKALALVMTLCSALFLSVASSADTTTDGTVQAYYAHSQFSMFKIYGAAAKQTYDNLSGPAVKDSHISYLLSKKSSDGRMVCEHNSANWYMCWITFDSTTGEILPTWK